MPTTIPGRTRVFGDLALEVANDREMRHRTVRFYELDEDGTREIVTDDGAELHGRPVASHYLSKLLKFSNTEDRQDGFETARGERRIAWSEWPAVEAWLREMSH